MILAAVARPPPVGKCRQSVSALTFVPDDAPVANVPPVAKILKPYLVNVVQIETILSHSLHAWGNDPSPLITSIS